MLRRLLLGPPLSERPDDPAEATRAVGDELDRMLTDLIELLRVEHTDESRAFRQAERELTDVISLPADDNDAVACKRGVLLFALWREPGFASRFERTDGALLADLRERVLPVIGPGYLANLGQRPDSLTSLCVVLTTLWPNEALALKPAWEAGGGAHL